MTRPWHTCNKLQFGQLLGALCGLVEKLLLDVIQLYSTNYGMGLLTGLVWSCQHHHTGRQVGKVVTVWYEPSYYPIYLFSLPIIFHQSSEKSEIVADWSELACSQTMCLP